MTNVEVISGLTKRATVNGKTIAAAQGQTNKTETPQTDSYDAAVSEAKQIHQDIESAQWVRMRLGELAAKVEKEYGENKLKQFAKDTGWALCTLQRSRSVWRAWADKKASPPNFSVAQELQKLPQRADIVTANPKITASQARKKRLEYEKQEEKKKKNDPDATLKNDKKWFADVGQHVKAIEDDADIINDQLTPERRQALSKVIDPNLLRDMRKSLKAGIRLLDFLQQLFDNAPRAKAI
jgi:hypothetical protein